jgi:CBS domain-containing protein
VTSVSNLLRHKGNGVWSLPPSASVYEAIEKMAEKGIGALLVMEGDKLVGIISERDYARKVILKGKTSRETQVGEIMSFPVVCARPDHAVEEVMSLMTRKRVRHLPVMASAEVVE